MESERFDGLPGEAFLAEGHCPMCRQRLRVEGEWAICDPCDSAFHMRSGTTRRLHSPITGLPLPLHVEP